MDKKILDNCGSIPTWNYTLKDIMYGMITLGISDIYKRKQFFIEEQLYTNCLKETIIKHYEK